MTKGMDIFGRSGGYGRNTKILDAAESVVVDLSTKLSAQKGGLLSAFKSVAPDPFISATPVKASSPLSMSQIDPNLKTAAPIVTPQTNVNFTSAVRTDGPVDQTSGINQVNNSITAHVDAHQKAAGEFVEAMPKEAQSAMAGMIPGGGGSAGLQVAGAMLGRIAAPGLTDITDLATIMSQMLFPQKGPSPQSDRMLAMAAETLSNLKAQTQDKIDRGVPIVVDWRKFQGVKQVMDFIKSDPMKDGAVQLALKSKDALEEKQDQHQYFKDIYTQGKSSADIGEVAAVAAAQGDTKTLKAALKGDATKVALAEAGDVEAALGNKAPTKDDRRELVLAASFNRQTMPDIKGVEPEVPDATEVNTDVAGTFKTAFNMLKPPTMDAANNSIFNMTRSA